MATRVYVRSEGTPDVTPSSWNFANQINPVSLPGTLVKNSGSAMTSKTEATGTTNPTARAMGRTILGPLKAQTINGTVKGQMRGSESNAGANATLALAVKIIKPDGTDRAVLLAQTASDAATAGNELVTSLTNATFKDASEVAAIPLTSQSALDGDYLVIEWGFRSATGTSRNITLSYGNDSATDLPEDTSTTAANNPWFEFSTTISVVRDALGESSGVGASSVVGSSIAQAEGAASGTVGGSSFAVAFSSGVGDSVGAGTSTVEGATTSAASGLVNGVAAGSGVSASTATGDGVSQGTSQASGIFAATSITEAVATGTSAIQAGGAFITSGVGVAIGTAESVATIQAVSSSAGQAEGTSTPNFVLTATTEAAFDSQGTTSPVGTGLAFNTSVGASSGVCVVSGTLNSVISSIAESLGLSSVTGIAAGEGSIASAAGLSTCLGNANVVRHVQGLIAGFSVTSGIGSVASAPTDQILILAENRIITVSPGVSTVYVPHESNRVVRVDSEGRTVTVPFEDRGI